MRYYRVVKKGLVSTGWIGECVGHTLRHRTLRFPNGDERCYNKNNLEPLKEEVGESDRSFIVVRKRANANWPMMYSKVHDTEDSAREEAIRLASKHPDESFQWLEVKGTVTNKQEVINTLEIV